jgi:hypothetical protein
MSFQPVSDEDFGIHVTERVPDGLKSASDKMRAGAGWGLKLHGLYFKISSFWQNFESNL